MATHWTTHAMQMPPCHANRSHTVTIVPPHGRAIVQPENQAAALAPYLIHLASLLTPPQGTMAAKQQSPAGRSQLRDEALIYAFGGIACMTAACGETGSRWSSLSGGWSCCPFAPDRI